MSTHPVPTKREPVLVTVALSPLRAIERTRGWRRLGLLVLYSVIALVIGACLSRRSQLAAVPDVGAPFDVAAFRSPAAVPDERNAFAAYRLAAERFRDMTGDEGKSFEKANLAWSRADAVMRGWVAEHDVAISHLIDGSARPQLYLATPTGATASAISENAELARRIGWIGTAGLFKVGRLRAEGDPGGAWRLLNAIVRAGRHIEWAVPTVSGRSHGIMLTQYSREPVEKWALDPAVSVVLLRTALTDLTDAETLTPPLSAFYRAEYLTSLDALSNLQSAITARAQKRQDRGPWHLFTIAPDLEAFLSGEPERSRRVLNLLVANDLAWCDRPIVDRPAFAVPELCIPETDAAGPSGTKAVAPKELARLAESAVITPALAWRLGELDKWERIDRWSMSQLIEALAVSLFTKETGHPPASPAEALRRYRPTSGDSPARDEAEPLP